MSGSDTPDVLIVGAGWAGLSTAIELTAAGRKVWVLESAPQIGGRARRVCLNGSNLDNGQHLMLGAYREMLRLMEQIGVSSQSVFHRLALRLDMHQPGNKILSIKTARLPAPLHLLFALLSASGLSYSDRFAALRFCLAIRLKNFSLRTDISVQTLLNRHRQSNRLAKALWEPLCLATLNTPLAEASAQIFLRVLRDAFSIARADSDLLIAKVDLSALFPDQAQAFIEKNGGKVITGARVAKLLSNHDRVLGVELKDGTRIESNQVVLAVPPKACSAIIGGNANLQPLAANLRRFDYQPIVTLYLQYADNTALPSYFCGCLATHSQWIFDRRTTGHPGLMAVVISTRGAHSELSNEALIESTINELAQLFPHWAAPIEARVIREQRATFAARVDIDSIRPANRTSLSGAWLAADYTNTGYPATLEGAVRSGVKCAKELNQTF